MIKVQIHETRRLEKQPNDSLKLFNCASRNKGSLFKTRATLEHFCQKTKPHYMCVYICVLLCVCVCLILS